MEAKILICIAIVLAALVTLSASYPLHQRASGTTHIPTSTRASRSSTSRGRSTPAPTTGNSRSGSGQRTTSDTTSDPTEQPQAEDTQSACEPQEKEELLRLAVSIESNVENIERLTLNVSQNILKGKDVSLSAGLYPAPTEQRFSYDNLYGEYLARSVNYLRCFLHPVAEALGNNSHVEVFTHETNYWRDFFYMFGNLTEAARDMETLALGREDRPGTSGCEIPSLNYACRPPTPNPPQVDGLTAQQVLQAAVVTELHYLCQNLHEIRVLDQEKDALSA